MADGLKGCTVLNAVWTVPDDVRDDFLEVVQMHFEFMELKSTQQGDNELISYFWAGGDIYEDPIDMDSPKKEGMRLVLHEVYRNEVGLRHHWTESETFAPALQDMMARGVQIEFHNNLKVLKSLWD
ncbi:hypothetical protein OA099_02545 [Litorivicinus sp.]|jgi:hypothetical protein|nr:hypothetical protein [Litorivicinus sp.]